MFVVQSSAHSLLVQLLDLDGLPVVGITPSNLTVYLKKQGATAFVPIVVNTSNFFYAGDGYYALNLSTTDTNTVGSLYTLFKGELFKDTLSSLTVVSPSVSLPTSPVVSVTSGNIYGILYSASNTPVANALITVKLLNTPAIITSSSEGIGITADVLSTKTDSAGYFTLSGVSGLTYEVYIPSLNFRKTFVMPTVSSNIFDL